MCADFYVFWYLNYKVEFLSRNDFELRFKEMKINKTNILVFWSLNEQLRFVT